MRRRSLVAGIALVALAACGGEPPPWQQAPPASIDLRARLSAESVPLLQEFRLTLDLFRRSDLEVTFDPQVPDGCAGRVELLPEQPLGSGRWRQAVLHLRPVRAPGELVIAPFHAAAKDGTVAASTPELKLQVTTLLAQAGAELEAPAPPRLPPVSRWLWVASAWAALLVVALLLWWRSRRSRVKQAPIAIAVPAHVKALRELARLRGAGRRTAVEIDAFYVATSQVLRVYLEERFGLRAPERTTEEFLQEVEAGGPLSVAQCLELRRFLQQCDLVKFAAQTPPEMAHLQTLAIAEQLVEATRQDRTPMEQSA